MESPTPTKVGVMTTSGLRAALTLVSVRDTASADLTESASTTVNPLRFANARRRLSARVAPKTLSSLLREGRGSVITIRRFPLHARATFGPISPQVGMTGTAMPLGNVALMIESMATLLTYAVIESATIATCLLPFAASSCASLFLTASAIASESARVREMRAGGTTGAAAGAGATAGAAGAFGVAATAPTVAFAFAFAPTLVLGRSAPLCDANTATADPSATVATPSPIVIRRLRFATAGRIFVAAVLTSPDEVVMLSSAVIRASAVGGLRLGSFARHCMMMADSGGATSGQHLYSGSGSRVSCAASVACGDGPVKGDSPVSSSYARRPTA